jgi:hypothetical protein
MVTTHFSDVQTFSVSLTVGTKTGSTIPVTVQLKDNYGRNLAQSRCLMFYLATDAAGLTPLTSPPDSLDAATGKAIEWSNNMSGMLVLDSTGKAVVNVTATLGNPTYYFVVVVEGGKKVVSSAMVF